MYSQRSDLRLVSFSIMCADVSHRWKIAIEVLRRCERVGVPKREEKRGSFSRDWHEHAIDGLLWSGKKDERERRFQEVCGGGAGTYVFSRRALGELRWVRAVGQLASVSTALDERQKRRAWRVCRAPKKTSLDRKCASLDGVLCLSSMRVIDRGGSCGPMVRRHAGVTKTRPWGRIERNQDLKGKR